MKKTLSGIYKRKYFIPSLIFIFSFLVYLKTMPPTVYWGDSGELITVISELGIPHPSGTPLYVLIGQIFLLIPFGNVAFKINFMSAFFASLSVVLIYILSFRIFKSSSAALISSAAFAFLPAFWDVATVAEVYTITNFFILLNIYILILWRESNNKNLLFAFCFTYGLSLTNHITSLLMLPAFAYLIIIREHNKIFDFKINRDIFNRKTISLCILIFLLGITPYSYLPLRSRMDPVLDWGNPETAENFINHVMGKEYHSKFFGKGNITTNLTTLFVFFFLQHSILIAFFFIGIYFFASKKDKTMSTFFLLMAFSFIFFNILYSIRDIAIYYIPLFMITSVFIGLGFSEIAERIKKPQLRCLFLGLGVVVFFLASILQNPELNKSNDYSAMQYSLKILESMDKDSVLLTNGDEHSPLFYFHFVENIRPDVIITPLQCIKDDYCVGQLEKNNMVVLTQNFESPVMPEKIFEFGDMMKPKMVYTTDIYSRPDKTDNSTWKIYSYEVFRYCASE